jgi:hypothetical protein
MMNFDHFIYNKSTFPTDEIEKKIYFKKLEEQFCEEIKKSLVAHEFFQNYSESSVEHFVKSYAVRKAHLVQCYEFYANAYHEKEISELDFQKKAEDMLSLILQKKLFNIQLLWRAGQIDIDEISMSYDFQFWEDYILSCPFISPIEQNEIDLMKEYLLLFDENDEVENDYSHWQNYNTLTKKDSDGLMDQMPVWYEYYDSRMGTGSLLLLPDYKGIKEDFYLDLCHKDYQKKNPPKSYSAPAPYLVGFTQDYIDFAKLYETDKYFIALFKYYNYYEEKESRDPNYDDVNEAIQFLFTADRPIYCHSHLTWDKAIMTAAKEYKNIKITESLDFVFEEYLMMKDLGFSKDKSLQEIKEEYNKDEIVGYYRKNILEGKRLNGEAEDFNY